MLSPFSDLETAELPQIYAFLSIVHSVIWPELVTKIRFDGMHRGQYRALSAYSNAAIESLQDFCPSWDEQLLQLLLVRLPAFPESLELKRTFRILLKIIAVCAQFSFKGKFLAHLPDLMLCYTKFLTASQCESLIIAVCETFARCSRASFDQIMTWGMSEGLQPDGQIVTWPQSMFGEILTAILNLAVSQDSPPMVVRAAFGALANVSHSSLAQAILLGDDNLERLWRDGLIPRLILTEQDENTFKCDPLAYFESVCEASSLHCESSDSGDSSRLDAYSLFRTLSRVFPARVEAVLHEYLAQLLAGLQSNPAEPDKITDSIILTMSLIVQSCQAAEPNDCRRPALIAEVGEFVHSFLLPLLSPDNQAYFLQADALKFLSDFRSSISLDLAREILPLIAELLYSPSTGVVIFAAHCVERLCTSPMETESLPLGVVIFRLFETMTIGNEFNVPSAQCILHLVSVGEIAIHPSVSGIISVVYPFLRELSSNPGGAIVRILFDILAALVTRAHVDLSEIGTVVMPFIADILNSGVTYYIPCAIQVFACYLLADPSAPTNPFYSDQFAYFLASNFWTNPDYMHAFVRLIRVYCIQLRSLVESHLDIIIGHCAPLLVDQFFLPHVFGIFYSLVDSIGESALSPILTLLSHQIFTDSDIPDFAKQFAVFLSYFCIFLGPDQVLGSFDAEELPGIVEFWLQGVESAGPLAFPGCMMAVKSSTLLNSSQQLNLLTAMALMLSGSRLWWGSVNGPPRAEWLSIMDGDDSPQRLECTDIYLPCLHSQPERDATRPELQFLEITEFVGRMRKEFPLVTKSKLWKSVVNLLSKIQTYKF
jgi:hypothetical protein